MRSVDLGWQRDFSWRRVRFLAHARRCKFGNVRSHNFDSTFHCAQYALAGDRRVALAFTGRLAISFEVKGVKHDEAGLKSKTHSIGKPRSCYACGREPTSRL